MNEDIFIRFSVADNVLVLPDGGKAGTEAGSVTLRDDIPPCHKVAALDIREGGPVLRYGGLIGYAAREIKRGELVHDHNVTSNGDPPENPIHWKGPYPYERGKPTASFMGYRRKGWGRPGIRNELWVIPAARCIKGELEYMLSQYHKPYWINSVKLIDCLPSCGDGFHSETASAIALGLARNPNAAGVLLVGLGCEKPSASELYDRALAEGCRVMCASLGIDSGDAAASVPKYLDELAALSPRVRESFPVSDLCVGLIPARGRYSGLTANPALGRLSDRLAASGSVILTAGTQDLFAAGVAVSDRITSREAYEAFVSKAGTHSGPDIPSMADWENGITTPKEMAMSQTPVIGESPVTGFLDYGEEAPARAGVAITRASLDETANCTLAAASGAQIILFATASGTPFGSLVPTVKISASTELAETLPGWIDFDAGPVRNGESIDAAASRLEEYVLRIACGELAAHEKKGFGEAAMPVHRASW